MTDTTLPDYAALAPQVLGPTPAAQAPGLPASGGAAAPGLPDYAALARQQVGRSAAQVRNNMQFAPAANPDDEARYRHLAQFIGAPLDTVRADPAAASARASLLATDADRLAAQAPRTAATLSDPSNARMLHDQIPNVAATEATVQQLAAQPQRSVWADIPSGVESTMDKIHVAGIRAQLAIQGMLPKWLQSTPNQLAESMETGGQVSEAAAAEAPQTIPGQVAAGLSYAPAGAAAPLVVAGAEGTAREQELLSKGVDPDAARLDAAQYGGLQGLIQLIPLGKVGFGQGVKALARTGAIAGGKAAAVGGAQSAVSDAASQQILQGVGTDQATVDQYAPSWQKVLANAAFMGALHLGTQVVTEGRAGIGKAPADPVGAADAAQATQTMNVLQKLGELATTGKFRERDSEAFRQFVTDVSDSTGAPDLFVDARRFAEVLDQGGVSAAELAAKMPDVAAQMREGLQSEGMVRIPLEDYAQHIAGGPLDPGLLPHLRTDPAGMSFDDAQKFYQGQVEALGPEAQKLAADDKATADANAADLQGVHDTVLEQLNATGRYKPEVAKAYAALTRDFYGTTAGRLGMSPAELFAKHPLRIEGSDVAGEHLDQKAYHGTPHEVDRFTTQKIGTGEGNQTYGWGMYFAGNKDVAEAYRKSVSQQHGADGGNLYKVEVPDEAHMLDYDASLKDQPEPVRAALEKLGVPMKVVEVLDNDTGLPYGTYPDLAAARRAITRNNWSAKPSTVDNYIAGGKAYDILAKKLGSPEAASRALNAEGVPGLHYADQGSRGPHAESATRNYVIFDDSHVGDPEKLAQDARGTYSPATNTITALHNADLSTYLHELGHHFLETYARLAAERDAPADIVADVAHLLPKGVSAADWLKGSLDERRDVHENFARGFEAYLMEGKAPTPELQSLYGRFRSWLLQVYKSLSALRVQLSPEVRGVMDRMLASQTEIEQAQKVRGMQALFATKPEGMSDEAFKAYRDLGEQSTNDAISDLQARGLRDMKWLSNAKSKAMRDLQRKADTERKAIQEEVTKTYDEAPATQAREALAAAEKEHDQHPTSADFNAQLIAEQHGFETVEAMHRAIEELGDRKAFIRDMTDQRMLEEHGDLVDPRSIERAAEAAVHNAARTRFIATELKGLAKATGSAGLLAKAAARAADAAIAGKRVRDLRPDQYSAAEARAGKASAKAFMKGDTQEAAIQKRAQLLSNALARSAVEAAADIAKGVEYLKRFDKASVRDRIDVEYRDQIDTILAKHDLRTSVTNRELATRKAIREWVEEQQALGNEPMVPQDIVDEANTTHFKDMTVESFRGMVAAVESIELLGKKVQKIKDGEDARDFRAVVDEAIEQMNALPQRTPETNRGLSSISEKWMNAKSAGRSVDASLLKMEQVIDWLDAHDSTGVFNRVVMKRIADAQTRENDMRTQMVTKLKELAAAQPKGYGKDFDDKLTLPGLIDSKTGKTQILLKRELLSAALNSGNESNYQKLLAGEKWSDKALQAAFDKHITKADWDYVQGVLHAVNHLWPEIEAMERRLGNTAPEKIEARPIVTPHGTYEGGYYPAVYDPLRAFDVEQNRQRSAGTGLMDNNYQKATTSKGHTKERNENYARPMLLSLDVIPRHMTQVIHDIAYREALMDADRFLADSRVREGVENVLGREYYQQFRPWLQALANDKVYDARGLAFWDKAAHWARTSTTIVGLGYRLSTMMIHGATAASNSIGEIGAKWMLSGTRDVLGTPAKIAAARDFIFERSGEMRNRMGEVDRDIRDQLRELEAKSATGITGGATEMVRNVKRCAFYGIAMLDMASALPTWMGAYNKGLHEGLTEEQAVYGADKAVRNAHGGTGTKDLAAIQRGAEFQKLFTMFYSFWNHFYNRQRDIARTAIQIPGKVSAGDYAGARRDFAMVLARSFFYFIAPQLLHAALKPPAPGSQDEDENWAHWAAKEIALGLFSGVPVVRDLANAVGTGRDYNPTPVVSIVKSAAATGKDILAVANDQPPSDRWLAHAVQTAGYATGLPTGQVSNAVQYLWDVGDGKQDPQGLADWWHGLKDGHQ